jgi:hypothetical protein
MPPETLPPTAMRLAGAKAGGYFSLKEQLSNISSRGVSVAFGSTRVMVLIMTFCPGSNALRKAWRITIPASYEVPPS